MAYKIFEKTNDEWAKNVSLGLYALKNGRNNSARRYAERAEQNLLSDAEFYEAANNMAYPETEFSRRACSEVKALKGLTYYSLKNPSRDAERALSLILKKQAMRRIKRRFSEPTEEGLNEIGGLIKDESSGRVKASLNRLKECLSSEFEAKYDEAISRIDEGLRICGVGKF